MACHSSRRARRPRCPSFERPARSRGGGGERIVHATRLYKPCYIAPVRRGRILAIKWGMNPNSSSLGVDVTFLLVGSTVLAMVTPLVGALLRLRGRGPGKPDVPA